MSLERQPLRASEKMLAWMLRSSRRRSTPSWRSNSFFGVPYLDCAALYVQVDASVLESKCSYCTVVQYVDQGGLQAIA